MITKLLRRSSSHPRPMLKGCKESISEAELAKRRAKILFEHGDHPGAIEASQHCIEHSVKALYRLTGSKNCNSHNPGKKLGRVRSKLVKPSLKVMRDLVRLKWISGLWAKTHSMSVYGRDRIIASKFFTQRDARVILGYSSEALRISQKLMEAVRLGELDVEVKEK